MRVVSYVHSSQAGLDAVLEGNVCINRAGARYTKAGGWICGMEAGSPYVYRRTTVACRGGGCDDSLAIHVQTELILQVVKAHEIGSCTLPFVCIPC